MSGKKCNNYYGLSLPCKRESINNNDLLDSCLRRNGVKNLLNTTNKNIVLSILHVVCRTLLVIHIFFYNAAKTPCMGLKNSRYLNCNSLAYSHGCFILIYVGFGCRGGYSGSVCLKIGLYFSFGRHSCNCSLLSIRQHSA